jgi:hypothetical protein
MDAVDEDFRAVVETTVEHANRDLKDACDNCGEPEVPLSNRVMAEIAVAHDKVEELKRIVLKEDHKLKVKEAHRRAALAQDKE